MGSGNQPGILREDAEQLVRFLCWRTGVKPPIIDWSPRHVRGQWRDGRIAIGPKIRDGLDAVIHEVAHHIQAKRGPLGVHRRKYAALYQGLRGRRNWHGTKFVQTLRELVGYWYGDITLYPWHTEYKSLRAAGARKEDR